VGNPLTCVEENENNTIAFDALVVLVLAGDPMVVA